MGFCALDGEGVEANLQYLTVIFIEYQKQTHLSRVVNALIKYNGNLTCPFCLLKIHRLFVIFCIPCILYSHR